MPAEKNKYDGLCITVLIPCYNEEKTIGKVIDDFKGELPSAEIVVYDNNSTDNTASVALEHGATVRREKRQGKGNVLTSMLKKETSDIFVMVDGDDTYCAEKVTELIDLVVSEKADMAVGTRLQTWEKGSFPSLHFFGNKMIRGMVNQIFGSNLSDILSGYRVFSGEVAKTLPLVSSGFEIETEMTIQLLRHNFVIAELPTPYGSRPEGSFSKLQTFSDGFRVLFKILNLFVSMRPLFFFTVLASILLLIGVMLGSVVVYEFVVFQYIYRVPTAILAASCVLLSFLFQIAGLILHAINVRFNELFHILSHHYHR